MAATVNQRKAAAAGHRGFDLHVEPEEGTDGFAVRLVETNGSADHQRPVAYLSGDRYPKAADAVTSAVKNSGQQPTVVVRSRKKPVPLDEIAGVRLTLALNVINGITKPGRTRALLDGIARLSNEECLYWYAACMSGAPHDARRLRALRLYLADD